MSYKRNVTLTYIIGALMWGRFFIPVIALFYIASQVSIEQFTIIMSAFAFTTFLLEVPSGAIADLLGKKNTLLISRSLYIVEVFMLAFYNGFWPLLIAKVISGIGVSLSSGTDTSLLYDSLKRMRKERAHKRVVGKMFAIQNVSMAFVFITGGFLFAISPKLTAIASLPFLITGFILTFLLKEPYKPARKLNIKNTILQVWEGTKYSWNDSVVRYLLLFTLPLATALSISLSISSAYLEKILIPVSLIGTIAFIGSMITALISERAYKFERKLGDLRTLSLARWIVALSLFTMALMMPYFGVVFYLMMPFAGGLITVLLHHYLQSHIPSSHRATITSVYSMFSTIGVVMMFPVFGIVSERMDMSTAFVMLGVLFAAYSIWLIMYSRKLKLTELEHKG